MKPEHRRVLMSKLLADANEEVLQNDKMRIGCFERTGLLMRKKEDPEEDAKIKPQGYSKQVVIDQSRAQGAFAVEDAVPEVTVTNAEIEKGWTEEDMDITEESTDIRKDDVVVDDEEGEDVYSDDKDSDQELEDEIVATTRSGRRVRGPAPRLNL